jgi:hypothetical protein
MGMGVCVCVSLNRPQALRRQACTEVASKGQGGRQALRCRRTKLAKIPTHESPAFNFRRRETWAHLGTGVSTPANCTTTRSEGCSLTN